MSVIKYPSLADQLSADPCPSSDANSNSKDVDFVSRSNPERMGNTAPIAFGGCIISVVVHAAYQTIPSTAKSSFHLYSVQGSFHGPTRTDRKLKCTVTPTRNTKTFATRRVIAWQTQDDGTKRTCADFFIDFHIEEPALMEYNAQPAEPTWLEAGPEKALHQDTIVAQLVRDGHTTEAAAKFLEHKFEMSTHYLDFWHCKGSVTGTNMMGLSPRISTPQDHLSIPEKTSAEWIRAREPLDTEDLNMAALAFFMDQALSYLPLNHDHKTMMEVGACSTLDVALRVFSPKIDMASWNFRQRKTIKGGYGRTYSEARLWSRGGELLCSMTQSCILRPAPSARGKGGPDRKKAKI